MKKYFIHNGTEQQGPFSLDDLKIKNINRNTSIWYDGLSDWTIADNIEELKELINDSTPPPFSTKQKSPPPINNKQTGNSNIYSVPIPQKNKAVRITLAVLIIIALAIGGITLYNNVNGVNTTNFNTRNVNYKEQVMTIEEIERSQPTDFLTATGTYKENFLGDKLKINCIITNRATVATYKDVVVRIVYYSKTKTEIGNKDYTVYEIFPPNISKTVALKIDNYRDVNSIGWTVISAKNN